MTARDAEADRDEPYDVDYDELYRDTADFGGPPWDIGGPQPALARGFTEPEWVDTEVKTIDVAGVTAGLELVLPGFLLRTVRAINS